MDGETEDHRGESEAEESHDAEGGSDGNDDSIRRRDDEDSSVDGENSSDDDSDDSDEDDSDDEEEQDEGLGGKDSSDDVSIESDVSDHRGGHLEDDYFEDKEDRFAFAGTAIDKDCYLKDVLPLKHNDENKTTFTLLKKYRMSNEGRARLGGILGRNTHLRRIEVRHCYLTANKLALLFGSWPCNNNAIISLDLDSNPIGSEGVIALKPFFNTASSLTELNLHGTNLGPEGIKLLLLELGRLPSLNRLILSNNNIGVEGLEGISMLCFFKLIHLDLGENGIGRRGCKAIANILRSTESSLVELHLGLNALDDECSEILARSLLNNTKLEVLHLNENCVRREYFCRLVCDTSSLSATHKSNHTLRDMCFPYTQRTQPIIQQLKRALEDNGRPGTLKDKACRKLIDHHFEKGNNAGPLLDMDTKLMPRVFSWINQCSDKEFGDGSRHNFIYQILRTLNVRAFVPKDIAPPCSTDDVR